MFNIFIEVVESSTRGAEERQTAALRREHVTPLINLMQRQTSKAAWRHSRCRCLQKTKEKLRQQRASSLPHDYSTPKLLHLTNSMGALPLTFPCCSKAFSSFSSVRFLARSPTNRLHSSGVPGSSLRLFVDACSVGLRAGGRAGGTEGRSFVGRPTKS